MTPDHIPDAGKMMPEALRLADHLERFRSFPDDLAAAAELRRLHTENEAKDALLRQALDCLTYTAPRHDCIDAAAEYERMSEAAIAALRERLGETK